MDINFNERQDLVDKITSSHTFKEVTKISKDCVIFFHKSFGCVWASNKDFFKSLNNGSVDISFAVYGLKYDKKIGVWYSEKL